MGFFSVFWNGHSVEFSVVFSLLRYSIPPRYPYRWALIKRATSRPSVLTGSPDKQSFYWHGHRITADIMYTCLSTCLLE